MPTVAIPFAPMPASQSPNIHNRADSIDVYLRAAFVALASFGRFNPQWRKLFVSSEAIAEEWVIRYRSIGVNVVVSPFRHSPPPKFAPTFAGALFLLDVVADVALDDYLLLIDPDVLCVGPLVAVLESQDAVAALALPYSQDKPINGLSRTGAAALHGRLGETRKSVVHYGGEFYGIPARLRARLTDRIDQAWALAIADYDSGGDYFTTEEHIMGFALAGMPVRESSDLVRRIWTAHRYRTVDGREDKLSLWHLPAEKERAFSRIFPAALVRDSWFYRSSRPDFVQQCGKIAGLHGRSPSRLALDLLAQSRRLITDWTRR